MKNLVKNIRKLHPAGGIMPGKITKVSTRCGNSNCKCMNVENPQKHIFNQLSYSCKGKTKTIYVKKKDVDLVDKMTMNYQELRKASLELGDQIAELSKEKGIKETSKIVNKAFQKVAKTPNGKVGNLCKELQETKRLKDKVKKKSREQGEEIKKNKRTIADMKKSRENWKKKHHKEKAKKDIIRAENRELEKTNKKLKKEIENFKKK